MRAAGLFILVSTVAASLGVALGPGGVSRGYPVRSSP
jgi:hypothetical protein